MSKLKYVKEFNKIVQNIDFLSSSHDVSLSNKLILIQQDLCDEEFNFNSFDTSNFFSNLYNLLLNHSSDHYKSSLINGCIDVLLKSTNARNRTLLKAMKFVNFLPAIIKLVLSINEEDEEKLMKLLTLIKNLLRSEDLDLHNTKLIIELLRDHVENSINENISKLCLNILANLTMKNKAAKYHVSRIIKSSGLQNKIDKSSDLVAAKFLAVIADEIAPKDFPHLITLSFKSIQDAITNYDLEPIEHSLDLLENSHQLCSKLERNISDVEENMKYFEDLNQSLLLALDNKTDTQLIMQEFFERIFDYFTQLLLFDDSLVTRMTKFTETVFDHANFVKSPKALDFLCTFITYCGKMISIEKVTETTIASFNEETPISSEQKIAFLKVIQALHLNGHLENIHSNAVLEFVDRVMEPMPHFKVCEMDEDLVFLMVHLIKTLSVLSSDYQLFNERLNDILSLQYLPIVLTNAYMSKDKSILVALFSISCIEKFPNEKVAHLLSISNNTHLTGTHSKELNQRQEISSNSSSSKYINRVMGQELNDLISKVNEKLDNNEMESLKTSDIISLYRHKNNYFNDHLNALNASLEKYTDLCNELQHQNAVLRKISEKQELANWCFQMDKELLQRENHDLVDSQQRLKASILTFQNKITKENQSKAQILKVLKVKEIEYEKLLKERNDIEAKHQNEKKNLKLAQVENGKRIEQLKEALEEEKKTKATEILEAQNEQKKISQKFREAEKENRKLQDVIKLNENELTEKQAKITQLEIDLKDAEKIQSSINALLQKKSSFKF